MTIPTDADIVELILVAEGSAYTNDPADAGGPTRHGITLPVLSLWLGRKATVADVQSLSAETARQIYRALFVAPFATLPDPLRVNVIDFGVNAGQTAAVRLLQQVVGATVDGKLGPQTRTLAHERAWSPLYVGARIAFYENLILRKPINAKWRRGWRNRALSFYELGDTVPHRIRSLMATDAPAFGPMGKAYDDD